MTRILHCIYAANGCQGLRDPIDCLATLEALAPVRQEVLNSPRTDIDTFRLIEDTCAAVTLAFRRHGAAFTSPPPRGSTATARPAGGKLIPFDALRVRLRSWAEGSNTPRPTPRSRTPRRH